METKKCSKCGIVKPFLEFHKWIRSKDGRKAQCKDCIKISSAKYAKENMAKIIAYSKIYIANNREKHNATKRKWKAANPEKVKASIEKTKKNNPEKSKLNNAKYRKLHPERIKESSAKWSRNNLEKERTYRNSRRTKKTKAGGKYSEEDILAKRTTQDFMCPYCTTSIVDFWHDDHIYSVENGGTSFGRNMQPTCEPCNKSKGNKLHSEFLKYREILGIPTRDYAYSIVDIEASDEYKYHRWLLGKIETPDTMFDASVLHKTLD